MKMERSIIAHPNGGAKCPLLEMMKRCNDHKCAVDCVMAQWQGWSACSSPCGGGVKMRMRLIRTRNMHGGEPCGDESETNSCNVEACDTECTLSDWTGFSACSRGCGGGTMRRIKTIDQQAVGDGGCPEMDNHQRLEFKECHSQKCPKAAGTATLKCMSRMDVVLLIDGSGSVGDLGWASLKKAGSLLAEALGAGGDTQIAVQLFSGPESFDTVERCIPSDPGKEVAVLPDVETDCKINWVSHFEKNTAAVSSMIGRLAWPKGPSLMSLALTMADSELSLGRDDAESLVIVLTDGFGLYKRKTEIAARQLRKKSRVMWVPITGNAPVDEMMKLASKPKTENFLAVDSFEDLEKPETIDKIVSNACAEVA